MGNVPPIKSDFKEVEDLALRKLYHAAIVTETHLNHYLARISVLEILAGLLERNDDKKQDSLLKIMLSQIQQIPDFLPKLIRLVGYSKLSHGG